MPKISIIVPVYKAETYLSRCLDSIINQTFKNFEVRVLDASSKITDVTFQDAKGRLWVSFTNAYLTPFSMNFTKVDCKVTADAITLVKKD